MIVDYDLKSLAQKSNPPKRIHERKDVGILFGRLLDHNTDAQTEKRLCKIDYTLWIGKKLKKSELASRSVRVKRTKSYPERS